MRAGRMIGVVAALSLVLSGCGTAPGEPVWRVGEPSVTQVSAPSPSASPSPSPSASPSPSPVRDDQVPEFGGGGFATAKGTQEVLGTGRSLITYRVEVETGIEWGEVEPVTPESFAAAIDEVWKDRRSWTGSVEQPVTEPEHGLHDASWRFQRVSGPQYAVRVRLATPGTVDAQCGAQGYDTGGKFSCKIGTTIMINLRRWLQGSPVSMSVEGYHAGVINHEMGHFLGFDHQGCPGSGELAPVMMQQSMGLNGCIVNPWPFTVDGEFVTGPYLTS